MLRKKNQILTALSVSVLLIFCSRVSAQSFGQNKVQYHYLNWKFIQSPHFDVYYTDGGLEIAEFTAKEAEIAYRYISEDFRWTLPEGERISIITYKSHNDFEQTNVMSGFVDEGVQGFTEFFKNRVVVPYQGSWEDFRHTIHHELSHAISMSMLYGSGMMSIIEGLSRTRIPLWFMEGLAEYESVFGLDTESEMYIRDLVVNSRLPNIEELDYYGYVGVYKCGQSVMQFIADTYGKEKIGELLHQIKNSRDAGNAIKTSLGVDWKELNRRWQKYINRYHWPVGSVTEQPIDFSEKITDHKEEEYNYYDISPAISPQGDRLVYISNKSDYFDVYLYSLVDNKRMKKLISGERSKDFEELHIIRPGISWSPDGKQIVLASKAGGFDALSIVDVEKAKVIRSISFNLDGIFSPSWAPGGEEIAFVGIENGHSDIYIVNLNSGEFSKVTDDDFSDLSPSWSPDGNYIVFSSDRREYTDIEKIPYGFELNSFDYKNLDIYTASRNENWILRRITESEDTELTPIFADANNLIYISDANGIYNLYIKNIESNESYAISNVMTGILQPSISKNTDRLVFVALYNFGYDIYMMTDPLDPMKKKDLKLTPLKTKLNTQPKRELPDVYSEEYTLPQDGTDVRPYKNFVFDFRRKNAEISENKPVPVDTSQFKTEAGKFIEKPYEIKFSADYVYANAYFSSLWGARGVGVAYFSDVLGDQNITLLTDLQNRLELSNYLIGYQYLPRRIDFAFSFYHFVYYFFTRDERYQNDLSHVDSNGRSFFNDRYYGLASSISYPFSKFRRIELNTDMTVIARSIWDFDWDEYQSDSTRLMLVNELTYVKDNSVGRYFGPINGSRYRFSISGSPDLYPNNAYNSRRQGISFYTMEGDIRQYLKAGVDYSFAFRLAGGASYGDNPASFFLGGINNWINRSFYIDLQESDISDIYVSKFVTPIRGSGYYERWGNRYFLLNSEFRFPFIQYLIFGWPIPYPFINVRGALFCDIGAAWSGDIKHFNMFRKEGLDKRLDDAIMGFGFGMRFPFPFIGWPTQWDVAWKTDLNDVWKPRYYLSVGYEL